MICQTCCRDEARFTARRGTERWVVCNRCKAQGIRLRCEIKYTPLPQEAAA